MADYWDADARRIHSLPSSASEHRERRRTEALVGVLVRCARPRGVILDAGMGDGSVLADLSRRGYECVGVDISSERVAAAERRLAESGLDATTMQGSVLELPFSNASHDAVLCSEVLEHLETAETAVLELARVVKPGGYVVVSVPWDEDLRFDICPECGASVPAHGHVRSFDVGSMGELLASAGLRVQWSRGLGSGPLLRGPAVRLSAALPRVVWGVCDALARSTFKPEWMVVQAQRPAL